MTTSRKSTARTLRDTAKVNVLVVDVGGSNVKILATGQEKPRKFPSGPAMTPKEMVSGVRKLARGWTFDVVSIGYPGLALRDRIVSEPHNLGPGQRRSRSLSLLE